MATLLRLADADLRDAAVLEAGRDPGNAPALAGQAVSRLVDAVLASERGWEVGSASVGVEGIPGQNPLQGTLAALRRQWPPLAPRQPSKDGQAPPAPDRTLLRDGIRAVRALLKDLAARFETDLFGTEPAGSVAPIRPDPPTPPPKQPEPPPPKPALAPAKPSPAAAPGKSARDAAPAPSPPSRPAPIVVARQTPAEPRPQAEPREIEGRFAMAARPAPGSVASTAFWSLMDRWRIPDTVALDLIGQPGGLTKKGTRPRFKLTGEAVDLFQGLVELDAALALLKLDPGAWLDGSIKDKPFEDASPLAFLVRTRLAGVRATLRFVLQNGLKMSLSA